MRPIKPLSRSEIQASCRFNPANALVTTQFPQSLDPVNVPRTVIDVLSVRGFTIGTSFLNFTTEYIIKCHGEKWVTYWYSYNTCLYLVSFHVDFNGLVVDIRPVSSIPESLRSLPIWPSHAKDEPAPDRVLTNMVFQDLGYRDYIRIDPNTFPNHYDRFLKIRTCDHRTNRKNQVKSLYVGVTRFGSFSIFESVPKSLKDKVIEGIYRYSDLIKLIAHEIIAELGYGVTNDVAVVDKEPTHVVSIGNMQVAVVVNHERSPGAMWNSPHRVFITERQDDIDDLPILPQYQSPSYLDHVLRDVGDLSVDFVDPDCEFDPLSDEEMEKRREVLGKACQYIPAQLWNGLTIAERRALVAGCRLSVR